MRLAELEKALAPPRSGRGPGAPLRPAEAAEDLMDVLQDKRAVREAVRSSAGEDPVRSLLSVGLATEAASVEGKGAEEVDLTEADEEGADGPEKDGAGRTRGRPPEAHRWWSSEWVREQPGGPARERAAASPSTPGRTEGLSRTGWQSGRHRLYARNLVGDTTGERSLRLATDPTGQWDRDWKEGSRGSYGAAGHGGPHGSGPGEQFRGEGRPAETWSRPDSRNTWGPTGGTRGKGGSDVPSVRVEELPGPLAQLALSVEQMAKTADRTRALMSDLTLVKQHGGAANPLVAVKQFALAGFGRNRSPIGLTAGEPGQAAKAARTLVGDPVGVYGTYGVRAVLSKDLITQLVNGDFSASLERFAPVPVAQLADAPAPTKGSGKQETDIHKLAAMAREKALVVGVIHGAELTKALLGHVDRVKALKEVNPLVTEADARFLLDQGFVAVDEDAQEVAETLILTLRSVGETPTSVSSAVDGAIDLVGTPGNPFEGFDATSRLDPEAPDNVVTARLERLRFVDEARTQAANAAQRNARAKKPNPEPTTGEKGVASARGSGLLDGTSAVTTPAEKRRAAIRIGGNVCIAFNSHDGCPHERGCRHVHKVLARGSVASLGAVVRLACVPHGGAKEDPFIAPEERPRALAEFRRTTREAAGHEGRTGTAARGGEGATGAARTRGGGAAGPRRCEEGGSGFLEGYSNSRPRVTRKVTFDVGKGPQGKPGDALLSGAAGLSKTAAEGSTEGVGLGAPPGLGAVQTSHHVLGQPLAREVRDILEPRGPPRPEEARGTIPRGTDSAYMTSLRGTADAVRVERPAVAQLDADCQALIYNVVLKEQQRHPEQGGRAGLLAGLEEASRRLAASTLTESALAVAVLDDKGATTLAAGVHLGSDDLAIARRVSSLTGEPLVRHPSFTVVPEGRGSRGYVEVAGQNCPYLDHGERLGGSGGHCVLLSLAHALSVRPEDLRASLREEATELLRTLGSPGGKIAPELVQAYQVAHDLLCPGTGREAGSYDAHLVRYLGGSFGRGGGGGGLRYIFIVSNGQSSPTEVHVIKADSFDDRPKVRATTVILLSQQHAVSLGPPASMGGRGDVPPRWTNQDGETLLGAFALNGLRARSFPIIGPRSFRDLGEEGEVVASGALTPCPGCGAFLRKVFSTRAGHVPPGLTAEPRVASTKTAKPPLLQPSLPLAVDLWAAQHCAASTQAAREGRVEEPGFSPSTLRALSGRRSSNYRRYAGLNKESITNAPLPPGAAAAAEALVRCAREKLDGLNRTGIKKREGPALSGLVAAVVATTEASETLMSCAGGPRASMLALRQRAYAAGEVPFDVDRLEDVRHLYDPHVFNALQNLANYGVQLFQLDEVTATDSWPSHRGAAEVAPELLVAALEDVGRGAGLLGSAAGGGVAAFVDAGATWSPVGSTPKRDAEGNVTGTRMLSDLRELNAAVAATLPEVKSRSGLSPPPAVCSDLSQLVRAIAHTHLRYRNGVKLVVVDLNAAYKLMHVAVPDAPAQTMAVPVKSVEGLSAGLRSLARSGAEAVAPLEARGDTRELAFMAGLGMFGGHTIPGYFGVPAWSIVQGASRLVAGEPQLNGKSTTPAQCHVDDAVIVAPDIGDRAVLAQRGYRLVAEAVFGKGSVNESKGGVGPTQDLWGYRVDLSGLYDRGLEAGSVVVYEAKFRKLLNILKGPGYHLQARRVVSSGAHVSAAGLLVWLSRTSVALRQLLGGFNVMAAAALQGPHLRPGGSPAAVDAAWAQYHSTLMVLSCALEDAAAFRGSLTSSVFGALSLNEQAELRPVSWIGTDASLEPKRNHDGSIRLGEDGLPEIEAGYGWVDHQLKVYACGDLREIHSELAGLFGGDHKLIIFVAEVLTAVAGAVEFGRDWSGHLKGVPIDNSNGYYAFRSFRSSNDVVRFFLGVLARAIVGHGFEFAPFWVWTKHNELPDLLSRDFGEGDAAIQTLVDTRVGPGYRRVNLMPQMRKVFRAFDGNPTKSAFESSGGAVEGVLGPLPWVVPRRSEDVTRGGAVVLGGGCGSLLRSFRSSGFERVFVCEPRAEYAAAARASQGETRGEPAGSSLAETAEILRASPGWEAVIVDATAWTLDAAWLRDLRALLGELRPLTVVVVATGGAGVRGWDGPLRESGYERVVPHGAEDDQESSDPIAESLSATELGGLVRREHVMMHFELASLAEIGTRTELPRAEPELGRVSPPARRPSWRECLDPLAEVPGWTWCDAPYTPSRRRTEMGHPLELGSVTLGGPQSPPSLGARVRVTGRYGAWIVMSQRAGRSTVASESNPGVVTTVPRGEIVGLSSRRVPVYSVDGSVPALDVDGYPPAGVGGALFLDDRRSPPGVRALSANELWALHGLRPEQLRQFREAAPKSSRRDQARAAVNELQSEVAEVVWRRLARRVRDLQAGLGLVEGPEGRWERAALGRPDAAPYQPSQVGAQCGGTRAGAPAGEDPSEGARRALGERLYAAAEDVWPGSGGVVAGCVLELSPDYGEELLNHPKELLADVRAVVLGSSLFVQVRALTQSEDVARRVTGMLLELPDPEVIRLTNDLRALEERLAEAIGLLGDCDDLWGWRTDTRASGFEGEEGDTDGAPVDAQWHPVTDARREGPPGISTRAGGGRRERPGLTASLSAPEAVQFLITNSVASGTHSTYSSSMKHWARFRRYRGRPIFFVTETPAEIQDELVLFVAFKGVVQNFAHGTVHVMLFAMRFFHVMERLPDPLANKPLLTVVLRGLKRLQGGPRRKIPVTMRILESSLVGLKLGVWDDLVKITASVSMFVFLLRSREALRKGGSPDPEQCLRVENLVMSAKGRPVSGDDVAAADEAILFMGKSKADQEGQGHVLNAYAADHWLCVVSLLKLMHLERPEHFGSPRNFLFTLDDGRVLSRGAMVELLRVGGVAEGVPASALSVISLRAGGASALWELGYSVEEIKRRGRWLSDAWRCYVWESRERWREVASDMLSTKGCLMAAVARFERP